MLTEIFAWFVQVIFFVLRMYVFWIPAVLFIIFWRKWIEYVQLLFVSKQNGALLEIVLPSEIQKSPLAMELFFSTLHQTSGESTFIKKWWEGSVRPEFTLELVSLGGDVKFFIHTWAKFRPIVETALYSQYPEVVIREVEDYAAKIHYDKEKIGSWGCYFALTKGDAYPIKSYVDYGLGKDPKEEYKIDPMAPTLEFLGSMKSGEYAWIQICIKANKEGWQDAAKRIVKEIKDKTKDKDGKVNLQLTLTEGEKEAITAIERSVSKLGFDCGIRAIYFSANDKFNPFHIAGLTSIFKQYNSNNLNGFRPDEPVTFDYPWEDFMDYRSNKRKSGIFDEYIKRTYFYPPGSRKGFVLSTEELATIFHLPSSSVKTPTLKRLESKRIQAPANLPI